MKTSIKYDLKGFTLTAKKNIRRIEREVLKELEQKLAAFLEEETVKRAPILEGFLQLSIQTKTHRTPTGARVTVYVSSNSPAADYALVMHEDTYKLGPISRQKQDAQAERVGNKYLERAIYENKPEIERRIKQILKRALR